MARQNRFLEMMEKNNEEQKSSIEKKPSPLSIQKDPPLSEEETDNDLQDDPKEMIDIDSNNDTENTSNENIRFYKPAQERRSVKKQILVTPSTDTWLRNTASSVGITVNELINQVLENAMK